VLPAPVQVKEKAVQVMGAALTPFFCCDGEFFPAFGAFQFVSDGGFQAHTWRIIGTPDRRWLIDQENGNGVKCFAGRNAASKIMKGGSCSLFLFVSTRGEILGRDKGKGD